jgi:hypothetical protein
MEASSLAKVMRVGTNVAQCKIIIKTVVNRERKKLLYLVDTFTKDGLANADSEVAVEAKVSVKVTKIQQIQRWSASGKINNMRLW